MLQIGDRIKDLRIKNGYTQKELARKLGIQLTTMQKYESGTIINVKLETLQKLCQIFQSPPSTFVFPNMDQEEKYWALEYAVKQFSGLNKKGVEKLMAYTEDLRKIEEYIVQDEIEK